MISQHCAHNVGQNSGVLYFENTIRYSFWRSFEPWVSPRTSFPKMYVFTNMFITRPPGGPQTWLWLHSMGNFTGKKMRYLPGPVDPQKSFKNSKKTAPGNGGPGGGSLSGKRKKGVRGAAPPGIILVFRMIFILVGATACTILYYTVLCCIILYYTILYYTILYYSILY